MTRISLKLKKVTNSVYVPYYNDMHRFLILHGGAGSGKSVFAVQKIIYRILTEKDHRFMIIRKVGSTLQDSVYKLFLDIIEQWHLTEFIEVNKQPMIIRFPCLNSEIIFKGMDDPEKIKSIAGITGIWYEEATEANEREFKEINRRLRGDFKQYKQIILTFNPIDAMHWLKKRFFDTIDDNAVVLKTTYKDNRFLDDEYKQQLEKEVDEILYNIYTLGEWGIFKGVIFTNWEVKDLTTEKELYINKLRHGLDWGVNDPLAVCTLSVDMNRKEMFIFEEFYQRGIQSNKAIAELIKPMIGTRPVVCDNAEPKSIFEMQQYDIMAIPSLKGKDSIITGIKFLRQFKIYIDSKCINAINEFRAYRWREDKNGNQLDEPVDMHNHFIDCVRYSIEDLIEGSGSIWEA